MRHSLATVVRLSFSVYGMSTLSLRCKALDLVETQFVFNSDWHSEIRNK